MCRKESRSSRRRGAAGTGRLILEDVALPATALLGGGDADVYKECVALSRLAWCALAVGTGQAVLDYVTAYVKDRKAFGEPISHRQAVAFLSSQDQGKDGAAEPAHYDGSDGPVIEILRPARDGDGRNSY